jgi:hypothetical protein
MFELLKIWLRSKYVCALEADVARLRAENRALMNSLLGIAGFPPVEFPEVPKPQALPRIRKRSWHQIQAWRQSGAERDAADNAEFVRASKANGPVPRS